MIAVAAHRLFSSVPFLLWALVTGVPVAAASAASDNREDWYGIGAAFGQADSASPVVALAVYPKGPAGRTGLQVGDTLLAVDTLAAQHHRLQQLIAYIRRRSAEPVILTVSRGSQALCLQIPRERLSEILAGEGLKAVAVDSTHSALVPLVELPLPRPGEVLGPIPVYNLQCDSTELETQARSPTFLYFWASWCTPCKRLIRMLRDDRPPDSAMRLRLVGINLDNRCDFARLMADSLRPPGAQFWGGGYICPATKQLHVYRHGIPAGVLIDPSGRLVGICAGADSCASVVRREETRRPPQPPRER